MLKKLSEKIDTILLALSSDKMCLLLILTGIFIRTKHYLDACSLWLDESWVAIEIMAKSFSEVYFYKPFFEGFSRPPMLFSLLSKFVLTLLGNHELSLRFIPFIASIISLFLFLALLKKYLDKRMVFWGLLFFVFNDTAIRYAIEFKQYSTDLMVALIILYSADYLKRKDIKYLRVVAWGFMCAVLLFLSNSSVFISGAVFTVYFFAYFYKKDMKKIIWLLYAFIIFISFGYAVYLLALKGMVTNKKLTGMWATHFLPVGNYYEIFVWLKNEILQMFQNPLGLAYPLFGFILSILGSIRLFKKDKEIASIFILSIGLTLTAACLGKYPFTGRLIFFLVPGIIVLLFEGISFLTDILPRAKIIGLIIVLVILFHPVTTVLGQIKSDRCYEDNREVMQYFAENYSSRDYIFINDSATFTFNYYLDYFLVKDRMHLYDYPFANGEGGKVLKTGRFLDQVRNCGGTKCLAMDYQYDLYREDYGFVNILAPKPYKRYYSISTLPKEILTPGRIWIFFSHLPNDTKEEALKLFDQHGKQITAVEKRGASLFLYEMN